MSAGSAVKVFIGAALTASALLFPLSGGPASAAPDFSGASLPMYERLRGVPKAQRPAAIEKSVLDHSRSMLAKGLNSYALDVRYSDILQRICVNASPYLGKVYRLQSPVSLRYADQLPPYKGSQPFSEQNLGPLTPAKDRIVVCSLAVNNSYNMAATYRTILIDSFMLDALYRVAQYKAHFGNYDNAAEQVLASYAASLRYLSAGRGGITRKEGIMRGLLFRPGFPVVNPFLPYKAVQNHFVTKSGLKWDSTSFGRMDLDGVSWANPARIPLPKGYNPSVSDREARYAFEHLLAPILCHELSHSLLGHSRIRLSKTFSLKERLDGLMSASEANAEVRRFLNIQVNSQQEREADVYAARLGRLMGLRVQDFEEGFWFLNLIEKADSSRADILESHPQYIERRRLVESAFMKDF